MRIREKVGRLARERPKTTFLLALLALSLPCILLSALIKTDRERVEEVISAAERALEAGEVEATAALAAPDYIQEEMDRDALRRFIAKGIAGYGPPWIHILTRQLELEGDRATCLLRVWARFPKARAGMRMLSRSRWRVSLRRDGRRWWITEVTPLEIGNRPIGGLVPLGRRFMGWGEKDLEGPRRPEHGR